MLASSARIMLADDLSARRQTLWYATAMIIGINLERHRLAKNLCRGVMICVAAGGNLPVGYNARLWLVLGDCCQTGQTGLACRGQSC